MDKKPIEKLYAELLTAWNNQDAAGMAALFTPDGNSVGFDGSQHNGPDEMIAVMSEIFAHHPTAKYVWKIREIRYLSPDVALLRGVAGMMPRDKRELIPEVNAIQSVVAVKVQNEWKVSHFQNTPAQYHGRPELIEALTRELQELV